MGLYHDASGHRGPARVHRAVSGSTQIHRGRGRGNGNATGAARAPYAWAALFAATGLLYNPVIPTFSLAGNWQVLIIYVTVVLFAVSLTWLKVASVASQALAAWPNKSAR
jgi:hypothetical protein